MMAEDALLGAGIYAYVPKRYAYHAINGRPKKVLEKLVPNLVFAYMTPHQAEVIVRNNDQDEASPCPRLATILSYYYDHFSQAASGYNPPLTVSESEMENFIRLTSTHDENMLLLQSGEFHFKSDEEVIVTAGQFEGVRGRVIRARGQQRVLVSLSNLCFCASAYIPSAFLQKL
jgi:transcription antitermination factor NusG